MAIRSPPKFRSFQQNEAEKQLVIDQEELSENEDDSEDKTFYDGGFYLGADPKNPQIGDIAVKFYYVAPATISIVAAQTGNSLEAFSARNGTSIALVQTGTHSADSLFEAAMSENSIITWLVRLGGLVLAIGGFAVLMKPLSVLADIIPILGSLVGAGTGLVSLVLGLIVSVVTIAIAWFAYRPIAAVTLLAAVSAITFLIYRRKKKSIAQSAAPSLEGAGLK